MKPEIKKLLILNAPYLLFVYLFDKVGQAVRLSPGADMSAKLLSIGDGFSAAFSNAFPSVHPADLLIGLAGAVIDIIQTKFTRPKERPYQTENFYAVLERQRKLEKEVSAIVKGTGAKGAGSRRRNKA